MLGVGSSRCWEGGCLSVGRGGGVSVLVFGAPLGGGGCVGEAPSPAPLQFAPRAPRLSTETQYLRSAPALFDTQLRVEGSWPKRRAISLPPNRPSPWLLQGAEGALPAAGVPPGAWSAPDPLPNPVGSQHCKGGPFVGALCCSSWGFLLLCLLQPLKVRQVQAANNLLKPDVLAQSCHEEFQGAPALGGPALRSLPFRRGGETRPGAARGAALPSEPAASPSSLPSPGLLKRGREEFQPFARNSPFRKTLSLHDSRAN